MAKEKCDDLGVIFHLECSHVCLFYYEYTSAREHLQTARKMTGLRVGFSGWHGRAVCSDPRDHKRCGGPVYPGSISTNLK